MARRTHRDFGRKERFLSGSKIRQLTDSLHAAIPAQSVGEELPEQPAPELQAIENATVPRQRERTRVSWRSVERRPNAIAMAIGRPILNTEIAVQSRRYFQEQYGLRLRPVSEDPFLSYMSKRILNHCMHMGVEEAYESYINASTYDDIIARENTQATATSFVFKTQDRRFIERRIVIEDELWERELLPLRQHLRWTAISAPIDQPLRLPIGKTIPSHKIRTYADVGRLRKRVEAEEVANPVCDILELGPLQIRWMDIPESDASPE